MCEETYLPFLDLPTASSSSIYTIHGAELRACWNKSLTLALPTPNTYIVCVRVSEVVLYNANQQTSLQSQIQQLI